MGTPASPRPQARASDEDDERFVQVVERYDEYLADQQHAIELLKQGFLKLTMAKMNLPAHAVSELSYKDEFESALRVVAESDGTLSTVKAIELMEASGSTGDSSHGDSLPSSTMINRRKESPLNNEELAGAAKAAPSSNAKEEDAAILWFSSLPPANLRLAQKHFRSALQALLVSAASVRKMQNAISTSSKAPHTS